MSSLHNQAELETYLRRPEEVVRLVRRLETDGQQGVDANIQVESTRRVVELLLENAYETSQRLVQRVQGGDGARETPYVLRAHGIAAARKGNGAEAAAHLKAAEALFHERHENFEAARTIRHRATLAAEGLVEREGLAFELKAAMRCFRRLRARPELELTREVWGRLYPTSAVERTYRPKPRDETATATEPDDR